MIIASCYFTTIPDPQRKTVTPNNNVTYIRKWYESLKDKGIIFHDDLSDQFISWFPKIEFIKVRSPNKDLYKYRWIVYFDYLCRHKEIESIFFTDLWDVIINNEPIIKKETLYCGDENRDFAQWFKHSAIPAIKRLPEYNDLLEKKKLLLNPGIVGGDWQTMYDFLQDMCNIIDSLNYADKEISGDMAIFNYVIYSHFLNIIHGYPVNSRYKEYETRSNAWFIHK